MPLPSLAEAHLRLCCACTRWVQTDLMVFFALRCPRWPPDLVQVFFCTWLRRWLTRPIRTAKLLPQNGHQWDGWKSCLLETRAVRCSRFLIAASVPCFSTPCGDETAPRGALLCWRFPRVNVDGEVLQCSWRRCLATLFLATYRNVLHEEVPFGCGCLACGGRDLPIWFVLAY